jgi:hypothetical protein
VQFLRDLFGEEWVQSVILSPDSQHPLALWHGKTPNNPVGNYANELAEFILKSGVVKCDVLQLATKLRADFVPTPVEMDYAVFLGKQGFQVTMEPLAPKRGPDLVACQDRNEYFVEIRKVGLNEASVAADSAALELFTRLRGTPSRFSVLISMTPEFSAYSLQLKLAAKAVEELLRTLPEKQLRKATLCWEIDERMLIEGDPEAKPEHNDPEKLLEYINRLERIRRAPFVAQFDDTGVDNDHTAIAVHSCRTDPQNPQPDNTCLRLRTILHDKRDQLPKGSSGIIVLELTELEKMGIDHFTLLSALYGDLHLTITKSAEGQEYQSSVSHRRNGFFGQTSRVSAVVVERTRIGAAVEFSRGVFPTNNDRAFLLTQSELECFGSILEDLKHLCRAG